MRELEIKFAVADLKHLQRKLRQAGFHQVAKRQHEFNTLYDFPDHRLRLRGEILRLRKYGKQWWLTHKSKGIEARHKSREEMETQIGDGRELEAILRALGFAATFQYEKFRAEWRDKSGQVVIDETPIGNFAEIEGPARWIDRTAKALGVRQEQYITASYAVLFELWRQSGSKAQNMTFAECRRTP